MSSFARSIEASLKCALIPGRNFPSPLDNRETEPGLAIRLVSVRGSPRGDWLGPRKNELCYMLYCSRGWARRFWLDGVYKQGQRDRRIGGCGGRRRLLVDHAGLGSSIGGEPRGFAPRRRQARLQRHLGSE